MNDSFLANEFENINNAETDDAGIFEAPLIVTTGTVVFPEVIAPLSFNEEETSVAVDKCNADEITVIVVARQPDDKPYENYADNLFEIGTEIALGQMLNFPDGAHTVLVQGRRRVAIEEVIESEGYFKARARVLPDVSREDDDTIVLVQTVISLFKSITEENETISEEVVNYVLSLQSPGMLCDFIVSTLTLNLPDRQKILETLDISERLKQVAVLLSREHQMLELRDEIDGTIREEMNRGQREMYLREQMRVIQMELGEDDVFEREVNELRDKIENSDLPETVADRARKELSRLLMMPPIAPEVGIIHTYIDWLVSLPWKQKTEDKLDIIHAAKVLDDEHYGLPRVKDRILEHMAVRKLAADKMKTPILCFVGPPGVGKTSLGRSIAKALGREFVRVSLGGMRDEAEIRGHRRTYIGAMPGRIIQTMRRAGTVNPVFMLDEIDKLGADFHGDPSSALLEVLDPEQNSEYSDHYLDMNYDLSQVLFITTANDLYPLEDALLDRLEVIEFSGYSEEEKQIIAQQFLIPEQLESHGLSEAGVRFESSALKTMIRQYTYEAGVRNLNRTIASCCRKIARNIAEGKKHPHRITASQVQKYLGPPQYLDTNRNQEDNVGLATGLAWTWGGGDVLTIEVSVLPGKGNLMMTGSLGDVMQESAQAAMSYMRSRARDLEVPNDDFDNYDVHVHLPEGAVPKDGPSAGITLASAIMSAFTERKIRSDFAMTGEITLRGRVLAVGGIKEKVLAAHRAQIKNVIMPATNKKDLEEIPTKTLRDLTIHFVDDMQQVMDLVLLEPPVDGRQRDRDREEDERNQQDEEEIAEDETT